MKRVAVIGAGPGGLVAARYLTSEGFEPVVFEQGQRIGGQWSGEPGHSGVWPSMRTNTSRVLTAFSDLSHDWHSPTYPTYQAIGAYLERYSSRFDLAARTRLKTRVEEIRRGNGNWIVRTPAGDEAFDNVVIATGRYSKPLIPAVPGLASFSGKRGVRHAFEYKDPDSYRGLRVIVGGCAISALEIASDLAMLGAHVTVSQRRQRYVLPKLMRGVPVDHVAYTRFAALAEESLSMETVAQGLKQFVLSGLGNPARYGAPAPADNILEAGITLSQFFLPLVAEGRITVRPWMECVRGTTVRFSDGSEQEADALLFATGYALHLPFLGAELRQTLGLDERHIDLYKHTFHPDLDGLAFLGLYEQIGPYFPSLELQARWIAYTFSGAVPAPTPGEMHGGVAEYRQRRGSPQITSVYRNVIVFARAAGVEPDLQQWPQFTRALLFGPLAPVSFRLSGHDALADAAERFEQATRAFDCLTSTELTPEQRAQLQALAIARGDAALAYLAA